MSFPSVQQAPAYTPVASSMPQQTAYIQQGQCGNCGVTLVPYPQTQLNQGDSGQYQTSAQGNTSGGTLQESHQFTQASGQSYVGGQGGQQQVETEQVESSLQSVIEASEAPAEEAAPAETGKRGFDFAAFFSPLNKDERDQKARNAAVQSEQSQTGMQIEQTQAEQTQAGQASSDQIMAEDSQPQMTEQIQSGEAGYNQGGQVSGAVGSDQHKSGQAQQSDTAQPGQHASAPAGEPPASSVPSQAFVGLSTEKMHTALAEMDREITEFTMSSVDQVALAYKQTMALAVQQRAFLQERGALPEAPCAFCGHFEVTKPVSSSSAKVQ